MNSDFLINILGGLKSRIEEIDPEEKDLLYNRARAKNGWFTRDSIELAFSGLDNYLDANKLKIWLGQYDSPPDSKVPKKVGIVMAGNIPMVGFHDLLCVMISGHRALIKLSSQDEALIQFLLDNLFELEPGLKDRIEIVERLESPNAVIATGSDNTARYFSYYFRNIPHIIRKNRTSLGVIDGSESEKSLLCLGNDILNYFGLGCRSVSKLLVPKGYDFKPFFEAIQSLEYVANTNKYVNNYDYNKSIYLVNRDKFLDNGFLLLKRSNQLVSPVSVLYYNTYQDINEVNEYIALNRDKIQCITSDNCWIENSIDFGSAQNPELWDYSDEVNTLDFLGGI
jgi:hypothetical protein